MPNLKAYQNIQLNATPTENNHLVTVSYLNEHFLKMEAVAEEWVSGTSYGLGAIVRYNGSLYKSLSDNNSAVPTNTSKWSATYITALADSSSYGLVRPDATTISIDDGTISVADSRKKTATTTETIALSDTVSVYRVQPSSSSVTLSFNTSGLTASTTEYDIEFTLVLVQGSTPTSFSFPNNLTWLGDEPSFNTASYTYFVKVYSYDGGTNWFAQPVSHLDSNAVEEEEESAYEPKSLGNVIYVTTLSDALQHEGVSLREAIEDATSWSNTVIKFSVSGTITLEQGEITVPGCGVTIDGENKITISGNNASRIFYMATAKSCLVLNNLVITGGNGVGLTNSQVYGGAVYLNAAVDFIARGVTFRDNSISGTAATVAGGAIYYTSTPRIYLEDCVFEGNSATSTGDTGRGGAFYGTSPSLVVKNCTFTNNTSTGNLYGYGGAFEIYGGIITGSMFDGNSVAGSSRRYGGAVLITNGITEFKDCTFANNAADTTGTCMGGAIFTNPAPILRIDGCSFNSNSSKYGGAVAVYGATNASYNARITNCVFDNNKSVNSGRATSLYFYYCCAEVEDCTFRNETVPGNGVIYCYGYTNKLFYVTINRCMFTGNTTSLSTNGLVYCANLAQVYLYNTIFVNNTFTATSGQRKCLYTTGNANAFVYNCTFSSNSGGSGFYAASGTISLYNTVEYDHGTASGGASNTVTASNFLCDHASVGRDITYNSSLPLFDTDGYTPVAGSQVIGVGNNTYVITEKDYLKNDRVVGSVVDLGAIEYC